MGRKPLGDKARQLIAARVEPATAETLKQLAAKHGGLGRALDWLVRMVRAK
jgi:hypothetical protein